MRGWLPLLWARPESSGGWHNGGHGRRQNRGLVRDGLRDGGWGVVQDPFGDLGDRGMFHSACEGGVGEGRVPSGGEAETWGEVAGMGLQEGGLTSTGDSAKAQLDEGPT